MNFKNYIKSKLKHLTGIATLAALVSQLVLPIVGVQAAEPRFNFLTGDYEMFRGANITDNESVWRDPVTGKAGDEFRGLIYYHNGISDSVAQNTRIKVTLPASTTGKSAKLSAAISADNASTITDTVIDGQIVGLNGLTANFDEDVDLEFVPGSTMWFPNATPIGSPSTPLPNGQSGNEIVSANGINVGDIQGCWEFAGFVSFGFRAKAKAAPELQVVKSVRNLTKSQSAFVNEVSADPGNEVQFLIDVTNPGNTSLSNVLVKDILPNGLTFVAGSLEKSVDGGSFSGVGDSASFFGAGLNAGTLNKQSADGKITLRFQAKADEVSGQFVNKAVAFAGNLRDEDTAIVNVRIEEKIIKSKSAFNKTRNEAADTAKAGNMIEYTLNTKNEGNININFVVEDDISDILELADVTNISDSGTVSGGFVRYPSVTIAPDQTVVRKFTVKVKNPLPNDPKNGFHFDDIMYNLYGNEVIVKIIREVVIKNPILHIEKLVRNESANEANFVDANTAQSGQILEYRINFTNTGDGSADQVRISDALPANVAYVAGTTRISRNGSAEQTLPDGIVTEGITLDTVGVGESSYIKFKVKIESGIAAGQVLVNSSFLTDDGKTISDMARTTITAQPTPPAAPTQLPTTGTTSAASFMITFLAGIGILYLRFRKLYDPAQAFVINQLLA